MHRLCGGRRTTSAIVNREIHVDRHLGRCAIRTRPIETEHVYVRPETMSECELRNNRAEQWRVVFHLSLSLVPFSLFLVVQHGA